MKAEAAHPSTKFAMGIVRRLDHLLVDFVCIVDDVGLLPDLLQGKLFLLLSLIVNLS